MFVSIMHWNWKSPSIYSDQFWIESIHI